MCKSKKIIDKFAEMVGKSDVARLEKKTPFEGVEKFVDIPYIDDGNVYHLLDVYRPADMPEGKKLPIIIDIHGGAWVYGTKDINAHYCHGLTKYGFVVVNISYRLITEEVGGTFPAILEDCFSAYKWVEDHIAEYGGDLNNVYLTGDSAGAHLAAMSIAVNGNEKIREELGMKTSLEFRAVGLTCGVSDVEFFGKIKIPLVNYLFKRFFGKGWKKHPHLYLATLKNTDLSVFPPIFLTTAKGDFMRFQVLAFDKILTERNIEHELFDIPTKDTVNKLEHVYSVLYPEWEESIRATDFLIAYFKKYAKSEENV